MRKDQQIEDRTTTLSPNLARNSPSFVKTQDIHSLVKFSYPTDS